MLKPLVPLVVLAIFATAAFYWLVATGRLQLAQQSTGRGARLKKKLLLTANELEFAARLEQALPGMRVCPQVSMGALLDVDGVKDDRRALLVARGRFSQKIVDFAIQDRRSGDVILLVELDDRTHSRAKDEQRDAMLRGVGYNTLRFNSKAKPEVAALREQLLQAIGEPAKKTA